MRSIIVLPCECCPYLLGSLLRYVGLDRALPRHGQRCWRGVLPAAHSAPAHARAYPCCRRPGAGTDRRRGTSPRVFPGPASCARRLPARGARSDLSPFSTLLGKHDTRTINPLALHLMSCHCITVHPARHSGSLDSSIGFARCACYLPLPQFHGASGAESSTLFITATFSRICAASGEQPGAFVRHPASLSVARPEAFRPAAYSCQPRIVRADCDCFQVQREPSGRKAPSFSLDLHATPAGWEYQRPTCETRTGLIFEFPLCLSRACLGRMIISNMKGAKDVFCAPGCYPCRRRRRRPSCRCIRR